MKNVLLKVFIVFLVCICFVNTFSSMPNTLSFAAEKIVGGDIKDVDKSGLDEPNWAVKLLGGLLEFIAKYTGLLIDLLAPTPEDIYMPGSPFLFSFSLTNFYGRYSRVLYALTSMIATIMIAPYVSFTGIQIMRSKSGFERNSGIENAKFLMFAVTLFWFLPELMQTAFKLQGILSETVSSLFNVSELGGFGKMAKEAAFKDEATLIDALIYCGSTVFSLWLMFNYIGMSLGFTFLFILAPTVIVSSSQGDRKTVKELWNAFKSYWMTPLIDIGLLGAVTLASQIEPKDLRLSSLIYNMMMIALLWSIIPMRAMIKKTLGLSSSSMGEMMGTGMMMAGVGMASRMGHRRNGSKTDAGTKNTESSMEKENSNGTYVGGGSNGGSSQSLNESSFSQVVAPPLKEHSNVHTSAQSDSMGHGYSEGEKIGNWKDKLKSDAGQWANQTFTKDNFVAGGKSLLKNTAKVSGAVGGASAGIFFGPAGVAGGTFLGKKAGNLVGEKALGVMGGIGKTYNYGKSLYQYGSSVSDSSHLSPEFNDLNELKLYESPQTSPVAIESEFKFASENVFHKDIKRTNSKAERTLQQAFEQVKTSKNQEYTKMYSNVSPSEFPAIDIKVKESNQRLNETQKNIISQFSSENESITLEIKERFEKEAKNKKFDIKSVSSEFSSELSSKRGELLLKSIDQISKETGVEIDIQRIEI